jgi:hypothetical protein
MANVKTNTIKIVLLFLNIIHTSILVLFTGLQYHEMILNSGVQTTHLGWIGPVSVLLDGVILTGYFILSLVGSQNY